MDTKGIGLSVTITEVSVLQTRSCMTLGNFETTQTVRLSVSVGRGFTVLLLQYQASYVLYFGGWQRSKIISGQ